MPWAPLGILLVHLKYTEYTLSILQNEVVVHFAAEGAAQTESQWDKHLWEHCALQEEQEEVEMEVGVGVERGDGIVRGNLEVGG